MKVLHSADWHLATPFTGRSPEQAEHLRRALLALPEKIGDICRRERCDLVLLSGDLFDGAYNRESYLALYEALERMAVPVFISPGNHDFCGMDAPWQREAWPENVHIFLHPRMESVAVPSLNCRVYGAGYQSMDCPGLLENFRTEGQERFHVGVLHADPTQQASPYCPVTTEQVQSSGLHYLALGHVHKTGSFRAGRTLCAWSGCPTGRGYDETGVKGVLVAEIGEETSIRFLPLDTPRFYDLETDADNDPVSAVSRMLPPAAGEDFYRITLTGYADHVAISEICSRFFHIPHLEIRDKTIPETDLWSAAGEDSLEGVYFRLLREAMEGQDEEMRRRLRLAARISRQILDGQEVALP